MLINGENVQGKGKPLRILDPRSGDQITSCNGASKDQALASLDAASRAFPLWKKQSLDERAHCIRESINTLIANKDAIIKVLMSETGKPIQNAEYDFGMLVDCLGYFIEEAKRLTGSIIPDLNDGHLNIIKRTPLGVVVAYLAWNFPLLNLGYKLGPALASGCTCVIKPSSLTPLTTLFVGSLLQPIYPKGVVNILAGAASEIASVLNESTIPRMITLIGSSETGKQIIKESCTSVKHYSLELGGNAPAIVFDDADIPNAARCICDGKFTNAGQICVSPNRVFVHKSVFEQFTEEVHKFTSSVRMGFEDKPYSLEMGPLSSQKQCDSMKAYIEDALSKGAELVFGGKQGPTGFFFEPTLIVGVNSTMRMYNEEIFGPIIAISIFCDADDIVTIANQNPYGLAAYVYTNKLGKSLDIIENLEAGSICVNEPHFAYNLPHGGVKESGIGKDCSLYSLEEYYDIVRISIKK